jgi:hypothetical protein
MLAELLRLKLFMFEHMLVEGLRLKLFMQQLKWLDATQRSAAAVTAKIEIQGLTQSEGFAR